MAEMSPPTIVWCLPRKPDRTREYWSWREIEGRPCWYAGRPGKPKELLRWKRPSDGGEGVAPVVSPPQGHDGRPPEPSVIIEPVPTEGTFERAWRDLMLDMTAPWTDPRRMDWK